MNFKKYFQIKVNRDSTGREVRYPVILSPIEKEISRKITIAFKQFVCGFDILRVQGRSYVCDVNGWSFVKNSRKYYDDASNVLIDFMLKNLRPLTHESSSKSLLDSVKTLESRDRRPSTSEPLLNLDKLREEKYDNGLNEGGLGISKSTSSISLTDEAEAGAKREELRSGNDICISNNILCQIFHIID